MCWRFFIHCKNYFDWFIQLVHWIDLRLCLGKLVGGGVVGIVYGLTSVRGIQSPRSPAVFGVVVDKHVVRDR